MPNDSNTVSGKERHFRNLLKGAGFGIVNLVTGAVIGLVMTPYMVSSLGERYYGLNEIIGTFVGCFMLLDLGIDSAVSRFFTLHYARNEKSDCLEIANTAFFIFVILGICGTLGIASTAFGIYFLYPQMEDRTLLLHVLLINGLAFGLEFPLKAFSGVVNGTMNQQLTGSRDLFFRILGAILVFTALFFGGRLYALSFINLGMVLLNVLVMMRLAKKAFPELKISSLLFQKKRIRPLFSFAFSTFLVFIGDTIAVRGGIFVIGTMLTVEMITPYAAVSTKLSGIFLALMTSIGGGWLLSWLTYLYASKDAELLNNSMKTAYKLCIYSATFCFFGFIVWAKDFIRCWMDESVVDSMLSAYPSLIIISAEHWFIQSQAPNTKYLFAVAKHHILAYYNLGGAFLQIFLMILFVKLGCGINGVALGMLLSSLAVRGFIIPLYVSRMRGISFFIYYLRIFSYMGIAAISCIIPYIITQQLLAPSFLRLILTGILCFITYVPVIMFLGFTREEKQKVKNVLLIRFRKC